jgi:4'-phosphopantetheinyl transferase EntD
VIDELLPPAVAAIEAFTDPPEAALFPEEEAAVARAVEVRRREYTTVRFCARRALTKLGVPPAPIVPGPRGAPGWPPGVVGSMTHCAGYRAAAVAYREDITAIGIDAEPNAALPTGVLESVTIAEELPRLRRLPAEAGVSWDRLLFCAKESVYKAWFPLTGCWLGFEDASITIDHQAKTFSARLLVAGPEVAGRRLTTFTGGWRTGNGLVVTAIVVPAG